MPQDIIDLANVAEVMVSPIEHREPFELDRFDCGCLWDPIMGRWPFECAKHLAVRPEGCRCLTPGQDDGGTTCWQHHDCSDGSCTHGE